MFTCLQEFLMFLYRLLFSNLNPNWWCIFKFEYLQLEVDQSSVLVPNVVNLLLSANIWLFKTFNIAFRFGFLAIKLHSVAAECICCICWSECNSVIWHTDLLSVRQLLHIAGLVKLFTTTFRSFGQISSHYAEFN